MLQTAYKYKEVKWGSVMKKDDMRGIYILASDLMRVVILVMIAIMLMFVVIELKQRTGNPSSPHDGVEMSSSDIQTYTGLIDSGDIEMDSGEYYVKEYTLHMKIDTIRELSSGVKQITGYDINTKTNVLVNMNFISDFRVVDFCSGMYVEITNLVRKTEHKQVIYTTTVNSRISEYNKYMA